MVVDRHADVRVVSRLEVSDATTGQAEGATYCNQPAGHDGGENTDNDIDDNASVGPNADDDDDNDGGGDDDYCNDDYCT